MDHVQGKFRFSRRHKCYMYELRSLRGVCPFVKSCLLEVTSSIPRASLKGDGPDVDRDVDKGNETRYASKLGGAARGSYVHKQLLAYCETLPSFRPTVKLHRITRSIIEYVTAKGWKMVDGDVPVWWLDTRMGTCVDLVCRAADNVNGYVLIEIKTGYSGSVYRKQFGQLAARLCNAGGGRPPATLHTMHLLQLLSTVILFNKAHPRCVVAHACVLHHDGAVVREYSMPTEILTLRPRIEAEMFGY